MNTTTTCLWDTGLWRNNKIGPTRIMAIFSVFSLQEHATTYDFFGVWWLQFPWTWRTAGVTPSCGNACASKWWQPQNHPKSRFLMNEGTKPSVTFEYLAQNEWDGKIVWLKTKQQTGIWDLSQSETGWKTYFINSLHTLYSFQCYIFLYPPPAVLCLGSRSAWVAAAVLHEVQHPGVMVIMIHLCLDSLGTQRRLPRPIPSECRLEKTMLEAIWPMWIHWITWEICM